MCDWERLSQDRLEGQKLKRLLSEATEYVTIHTERVPDLSRPRLSSMKAPAFVPDRPMAREMLRVAASRRFHPN